MSVNKKSDTGWTSSIACKKIEASVFLKSNSLIPKTPGVCQDKNPLSGFLDHKFAGRQIYGVNFIMQLVLSL